MLQKEHTEGRRHTNGAHAMQGSTVWWSCIDKWVAFFLHYLCCMANVPIFFRWKVFQSGNTKDPPWRMMPQTEHTMQGSTDGWRSQQTTPTKRAHRVFSSFPWVSNNEIDKCLDCSLMYYVIWLLYSYLSMQISTPNAITIVMYM